MSADSQGSALELPRDIVAVVHSALAEDVGDGDITARLIGAEARANAVVVCRERAILCGTAWFQRAFTELDAGCSVAWKRNDAEWLDPGDIVCELEGRARALLTGERTALNFLQTLSGSATATRRYAEVLSGTDVVLLDTRKTIPGLRSAQKYAVLCGGGNNHRMGLFDGILIKENHIEAAGSIARAVARMRSQFADIPIEVEVESIPELEQAIAAGADIVLLDNFPIDTLRDAVRATGGRAKLEASGGFELDAIR
ncbi:MAG TPA: carboxylating nicotinate-nucleotide diphosphorylase, partial [Gammaproteobacteria bacterium]|nr:carboxylating nicotinate-nucleotide diphosphorylase [Gammaproteobacteria bacterium]